MREFINESLDVFHGSDRKFDRFDMSKVGSAFSGMTGGWGIYFSDRVEVANRYVTSRGFLGEYSLRSGNYFDLDNELDDDTKEKIQSKLADVGVEEDDVEQFGTDFEPYNSTNMQVYDWLSVVMQNEKSASMFLKKLGYDGNKFKDKIDTDATNYVVFDTSEIIYK